MKKDLKNILVPIDFNEPSIKAFKYALNMATRLKSEIILLHVIQTPRLVIDFFMSAEDLFRMTNRIKEKLIDLANSVSGEDKGIKVHSKVERGKPYSIILKIAKESRSRMIILGENHQGTDANQELGSTVYHVTLKAPVPVLTLKGDTTRMNDKIVVPLDLTTKMRRQLFSALVYGVNYGAKIYLVSALIGGIKMRESRIFKKLKLAKRTLQDNGVECSTKLFSRSEEPPFRKIIQYAKDIDAGLILVMTHKEGYTYDNYIGAFAHHIINKSSVPVLSLTSVATNFDFSQLLKSFVDPAGMLIKEKE